MIRATPKDDLDFLDWNENSQELPPSMFQHLQASRGWRCDGKGKGKGEGKTGIDKCFVSQGKSLLPSLLLP